MIKDAIQEGIGVCIARSVHQRRVDHVCGKAEMHGV